MKQEQKHLRTAVFTGSFFPYTKGHDDIVRRALKVFDRIVIGVGFNLRKESDGNLAYFRSCLIKDVYKDDDRVEAMSYEGLTVDFARSVGACAIIRGVRTVKDYEYEWEQAQVNRLISGGIETLILLASPEYETLSSSMVRELYYFNHDVTQFLPEGYDAKAILQYLPREGEM